MSNSAPPNGQVLQQRMLIAIDKLEVAVTTMQVAVAELTIKLSYLPCKHHEKIVHEIESGKYARTEELSRVEQMVRSRLTWRMFFANALGTGVAAALGIVTYLQLLN